MPTMTQHSPEFTMSDAPGPADAPDILPAAEPELDTAVQLPDGASAIDDGEVLVDTTETGSFGELTTDTDPAAAVHVSPEADAALFGDEPTEAVTSARAAVDAAFEEPAGEADAANTEDGHGSGAVEEATPDVALTSVADTEAAADEPATGNGNGPDDPNTPKPPTGGNGGHEDGEDGEDEPERVASADGDAEATGADVEDADEADAYDQAETGPEPLTVPQNFAYDRESSHWGQREVWHGTEELPDGSSLRVNVKVMGNRDTGGFRDGQRIKGMKVVGEAALYRDNQLLVKAEDLSMVFPYDTKEPGLEELMREDEIPGHTDSSAMARRGAEATLAALDTMRATQAAAAERPETPERPDQINDNTKAFLQEVLGNYPHLDQLSQAEGAEIAGQILNRYLSSWDGRNFKEARARMETAGLAKQYIGGRSKDEIAQAADMAGWTVGSRMSSIGSWLAGKPEWKTGVGKIRENLSRIIEQKTRPAE